MGVKFAAKTRNALRRRNSKGPFKCYLTQMGVGGVAFSGKKCYEGVRFNVMSVTRGSASGVSGAGGPISRKSIPITSLD